MRILAGADIGGTKCAVSVGGEENGELKILFKEKFPTPPTPKAAVSAMVGRLRAACRANGFAPAAVGISCGGPLDSRRGVILGPPNLPGWDRVEVAAPFEAEFGVPARVQNDADACALAEWRWGAGRGTQNMVFLTFGTGMGAGLILGGRLYTGANDLAGEVGHIRLAESGPEGYGKNGSFEGFCSGGGMARCGAEAIRRRLGGGKRTALADGKRPEDVTAADIAAAARAGDELALSIMRETGRMLGRGVAILIDILDPERIVIGSIFARQEELLRPAMEAEIAREALSRTRKACEILPSALGENIGDYAALGVAASVSDSGEI